MILTDDFVFIHLPKTGGTFVSSIVHTIYPSGVRRLRARLRGERPLGAPAVEHGQKHDPRSKIPSSHDHLPVLATVRGPYEAYVSDFEFGEWRKGEENRALRGTDWRRVRAEYPGFPDLSFAEYLAVFGRVAFRRDVDDRDVGWRTVRTAWQFSPSPAPVVTDAIDVIRATLLERTLDVEFIHTEQLNRELWGALGRVGVADERRQFVLAAPKVLPTKGGRRADQRWPDYYDDELRALVRRMDAPLFERFPEYDTD